MPQRPNVIMIVADDMGYGDFGRFNDGYVRTPYLDRLIDESVCLDPAIHRVSGLLPVTGGPLDRSIPA